MFPELQGATNRRRRLAPPHRRAPHDDDEHEAGTGAEATLNTGEEVGFVQCVPALHPLPQRVKLTGTEPRDRKHVRFRGDFVTPHGGPLKQHFAIRRTRYLYYR